MKAHIEHFGCKQCGGTLGAREGERIVTCDFCGTRNLVTIEDHVPRYVLKPVLSLDDAKHIAMRLTRERGLASDLSKESRFYDAGLYYLPVFELSGVRAGKITSTTVKKLPDGRTMESSKANVLMSDVNFSSPATRLGDWGIENIPLDKQRLSQIREPFDPSSLGRDAFVFDPTIPPEKFEAERGAYEGYMAGDQTKIINKNLSIVFSPVWLIKYTYHGRLYRIVIDAILGETLFARAPAGDADRIPLMLIVTLMFTYPLARALRFFLEGGTFGFGEVAVSVYLLGIPALLAVSVGLVGLAIAWNQFRYSGEVVWRGGTREVERINKPPETTIERIARSLIEITSSAANELIRVKPNRWYDSTF